MVEPTVAGETSCGPLLSGSAHWNLESLCRLQSEILLLVELLPLSVAAGSSTKGWDVIGGIT